MPETIKVATELAANPILTRSDKELLMGAGRPVEAWSAHKREIAAYATLLKYRQTPKRLPHS